MDKVNFQIVVLLLGFVEDRISYTGTPFVRVDCCSDYLQNGNVKISDKSLAFSDQEESLIVSSAGQLVLPSDTSYQHSR